MEVEQIIEKFIKEELLLSDENLDHEKSLILTGAIESLGLLRMIAFVEEQFSVKVADEDVVPENFDSVALIAHYVKERQ
jgi:acyl carrier protein